jgi:hypothetical protein
VNGTEPAGIETAGTGTTAPGTTGLQGNGPRWWRSAPAAALLNLTGLGLGYLYLGYRWRVLAATVLAGAALDAWRLARTGPREPSPDRADRIRPVAVALAAVVAVVGAYLGYGAAGRSVYADALSAQARAGCPAAIAGSTPSPGPSS